MKERQVYDSRLEEHDTSPFQGYCPSFSSSSRSLAFSSIFFSSSSFFFSSPFSYYSSSSPNYLFLKIRSVA